MPMPVAWRTPPVRTFNPRSIMALQVKLVSALITNVFARVAEVSLNQDKSGWAEHLAEYVILIGLADGLFTDLNRINVTYM